MNKDGKIVIARLWHSYNGIVPVFAQVYANLDKQKYQSVCIYLNRSSNLPNSLCQQNDFKEFYISKARTHFFSVAALFKLVKILKRNQVDILHCHCTDAIIYAALAAKIAGVKIVVSQVDNFSEIDFKKFSLKPFALRKCSKILALGQSLQEEILKRFRKINAEKVASINNIVDYEKFSSPDVNKETARNNLELPQDSLIFASVGKLIDGIDSYINLVKAFGQVKDEITNAHLVIIGSEKFIDSISQHVSNLEFSDAIHLIANTEEIENVLVAFDMYVQPAFDHEPQPVRVLQAISAGLPCIALASGDIPVLFDEGKRGLVLDGPELQSIADKMIELATSPHNKVLGMINSATLFVEENFKVDNSIAQLEKFYSQLLG